MTVIIISGGIDLSVGSVVALTTVVIALLLGRGWSPLAVAIAGVIAAAICGVINGLLITGLRVVPFIVTLGTMILVRGGGQGICRRSGASRRRRRGSTICCARPAPDDAAGCRSACGSVLLLALLVGGLLRYTRFGRHVFAIGSNERTARLCGIAVPRRRSRSNHRAIFAGIAGVLQFSAPLRWRSHVALMDSSST
jgi:ribose/xylose/arabinose/galactoside ABC-type transport system permease subunit